MVYFVEDLVVIIKRLRLIVISSTQALIHNQILYKVHHISKVHTCTRMNFNPELNKGSPDIGIGVDSNTDLNAIAKDIYFIVDTYTNNSVVTTIIIDTTVITDLKNTQWNYSVRSKFKNLNLRQPNVTSRFFILPTIYYGKMQYISPTTIYLLAQQIKLDRIPLEVEVNVNNYPDVLIY